MPAEDIDLTKHNSAHLIGIGGAGMGAIAEVLAVMGHTITGSDIKDSYRLDRLRAFGVEIDIGHRSENIRDVDFVAHSTAISSSNIEISETLQRGIHLLSREKVLRSISQIKDSIAVAGTHGKTTTSSMLSLVLRDAGLKPSFIIGGEVNEIGTGAVWDSGELLVIEADESDASFRVQYSKNQDNSIALLEFLTTPQAQKLYSSMNYEYPVNPTMTLSNELKSWGNFKEDELPIEKLAELAPIAQKIIDRVGW